MIYIIYIHEYSHALFLEDDSEIFKNIMEAKFINKYCNNEQKLEIIERIKKEIEDSDSINHIIGKKIKLKKINI